MRCYVVLGVGHFDSITAMFFGVLAARFHFVFPKYIKKTLVH